MARRICIVLNQFSLSSKLLDSLVECIVFVIRAMTHNPHLNVVPVENLVKHRPSSSLSTSMRKRKIDRGMLSDADHDDEDDDEDDDDDDDDDFIASAYANNIDNQGDEEEAHSSWSRAMEIADAATLDITAADGDDDDDDKVVDVHDDDDDDDGQRMESATLPTQNSTLLIQRPSIDIVHHTNSSGDNGVNSSDRDIDGDVDDHEVSSSGGAHWVMHRLRGIGSDSRGNRRLHVIKVSESETMRCSIV
jgi:hypothetical protein